MVKSGRFQPVQIVLFSVLAAVVYGILHDLVTAHICVEYFTVAHPPLYLSDSPIVLALAWGVLATWWVGAILGTLLAVAARVGPASKVDLAELKRPIIRVMLASASGAALGMLAGAALYAIGTIGIYEMWQDKIPTEKHHAFVAVAWAHTASYLVGGLAGAVLIIRTAMARYPRRQQA